MNIEKNLFGGITAAIIALPLGLAFGVASGLGATSGIYGAIILGFFASLFGGTNTQISGPTGPMTVVMASAVLTLNQDINMIMAVVLLAGLFQILFGILKIGKFVHYIPYPVISGFMSGIGIIIIILQINSYLGLSTDSSIIHTLMSLSSNLSHVNYQAFFVASFTLCIMFFTPHKISKIIPQPLIALILVTPISVYLHFDIATIGNIPSTFPNFVVPIFDMNNYTVIITLALTLGVLGTIDTLLTSKVADSITHTRHKSNKELIGQGIGNSLCSLFGAIPGAGATMRTVINIKSGGTHKISGMIHALVLLVIVLFLAPLASQVPMALLAGILIKVGIDILDYKFLKILKNAPKNDLIVMFIVFLMTVFVDLITAVAVGIVLSLLLIRTQLKEKTKISLKENESTKTSILKIDGFFYFGSIKKVDHHSQYSLNTKHFIIDIEDVTYMDISVIFSLFDLIEKLNTKELKVTLICQDKQKKQLRKLDQNNALSSINFNTLF